MSYFLKVQRLFALISEVNAYHPTGGSSLVIKGLLHHGTMTNTLCSGYSRYIQHKKAVSLILV